jgi:hypothetical protein
MSCSSPGPKLALAARRLAAPPRTEWSSGQAFGPSASAQSAQVTDCRDNAASSRSRATDTPTVVRRVPAGTHGCDLAAASIRW